MVAIHPVVAGLPVDGPCHHRRVTVGYGHGLYLNETLDENSNHEGTFTEPSRRRGRYLLYGGRITVKTDTKEAMRFTIRDLFWLILVVALFLVYATHREPDLIVCPCCSSAYALDQWGTLECTQP